MLGLLAEATVAREDDFGMNDTIFRTTTHLGHLLKAGDCVLGYDLSNLVMDIANERRFNELSPEPLEIILVKKSFEKTREKKKKPRKQRRPRKGQGDAPQEELPTGHSSNSTGAVGDRKTGTAAVNFKCCDGPSLIAELVGLSFYRYRNAGR